MEKTINRGFYRLYHNEMKGRNLLSKVLKPLNEYRHLKVGDKQPKKVEEMSAKSHRMLVDYGLLKPCHQGSYAYMPFALRSLAKLEKLIDEELSQIDCQKIMLPSMTEGNLWKKSGRWKLVDDELFKLKTRRGHDFVLGPTFEEAVTELIANLGKIPYKSCPIRLYQISPKYRDEMKSKFGLIRSREFIMKDLYTFDTSVEAAKNTYSQVRSVYDKIFNRLNVPYVSVQGDTGSIGGTVSHEYHFISQIGQDELVLCQNCGYGANLELITDGGKICPSCGNSELQISKGIEVGHTFFLGDKYSKIFGAKFIQKNGKPEVLEMGCYGIGVSRILAASLEVLSNESELSWPAEIVPYQVVLIAPKGGSNESKAIAEVNALYDQLNSQETFKNDIIIDDRYNLTVGKKLKEAKETGYSHIVLFGKDCIDERNPVVELYNTSAGTMIKLPVNQVMYHFETLTNSQNI